MAEITEGLLLGLMHRDHHGFDRDQGRDGYRTEQNQANMSLMAAIGAVDKSVALGTATVETSNAVQTGTLSAAVANSTAANMIAVNSLKDVVNASTMVLAQQLAGVDRSILESRYELSKDVTADGDKTRALITSNYQETLNRQLGEANAALIELRSEDRANRRAYDSSVNVTQTVNQAQSQAQMQSQFDRLYHMIGDASQNIRATNQAINFGGKQTANPETTNTNNKVK